MPRESTKAASLTFLCVGRFCLPGEFASDASNDCIPYPPGVSGDGIGIRGDIMGAIAWYIGVPVRSLAPGVSGRKLEVLIGAMTSPRAIASASLRATVAFDGRPRFFGAADVEDC